MRFLNFETYGEILDKARLFTEYGQKHGQGKAVQTHIEHTLELERYMESSKLYSCSGERERLAMGLLQFLCKEYGVEEPSLLFNYCTGERFDGKFIMGDHFRIIVVCILNFEGSGRLVEVICHEFAHHVQLIRYGSVDHGEKFYEIYFQVHALAMEQVL